MEGIKANMEKIDVADTAIARYTAEPSVNVGSAALTLGLIMKEKYIACFLSPVTWDDMRRTDYAYKDFMLPANAVLNTFIRRMYYPVDEYPQMVLMFPMWNQQIICGGISNIVKKAPLKEPFFFQ